MSLGQLPEQPPAFVVGTQTSLSNQGGMVGIQSIHSACQLLYPDQPNPLQVTARLKYWLGGPDPLDYISMYWNPGRADLSIPPHWHYISFGLSDLHGDGRVHPIPPSTDIATDHSSGFGIELTMRVLGDAGTPPTWPAALLQRLATYIFTTGNCVFVGDHVSWHTPLDGGITTPPSSICHMIIAQDPQLAPIQTPLGKVQFVQVVGVTKEELRAAQRCGGAPLLAVLSENPRYGGAWLVTDMNRRCWVEVPGPSGPSDLSGVAAHCQWEPLQSSLPQQFTKGASELAETVKDEIKCILQKGLSEMNASDQSLSNDKEIAHKDDCSMSTESVKFIHIKASSKESQSELPNVKSLMNVKHESPSMSTDSFKMTEMENALMEDITLEQELKDKKCANLEPKSFENQEGNDNIDKNSIKHGDRTKCLCEISNKFNDKSKNADVNMNGFPRCHLCVKEDNDSIPTILSGVHLIFDREAASLLPLALRGRVLHKSHFTWSRVGGGQVITLLGSGVTGTLATSHAPIAAHKGWLQILIPENLAHNMINQLNKLESESEGQLESPHTIETYSFHWGTWQMDISVLPS